MAGVDYSNLAKYFSSSHTPSSGANQIAKLILLNADVKRGGGATPANNGPSLMSRIFDVLSRPRYAVANTIQGMVEGGGSAPDLRDFFAGLSGEEKTSYKDVLETAGVDNKPLKDMLGFGLDVAADPVNFIPVAGIINKLKPIKEALPEVSALQRLTMKGEPVNPELYGLPTTSGELPKAFAGGPKTAAPVFPKDLLAQGPARSKAPTLDLPGVGSKIPLPEVTSKAAPTAVEKTVGQIPFKLDITAVKKPATELVDDIIPPSRPVRTGQEFEPRHAQIADEILGNFDPAKATAGINKAHPDTLNAKQQVWLYHRAINAAKQIAKKPDWVASHANKIYAAMESTLRAKGYVPRLGSGENVSLYDVIRQVGGPQQAKVVLDHFAKDLKPDNPIWDAVEGLRAANAIDESKSVKFIVDKATEAKDTLAASGTLSDAGEKAAADSIIKFARQAAKVAPIGPAAESTTKALLDQIFKAGKSPVQVAIEQKSRIVDDLLAGRKASRPDLNSSVTKSLEKNLGKLPAWAVNDNKGSEFLMSRVATWWGQKDLRPLSITAISSASATAAARGKALNSLFKGFDETQRAEALAVAQGLTRPTSEHTARLADELSKMMSNLVNQVAGTSVVARSAVDMDLLNKWMRTYGTGFEFTKSNTVKDIAGNTHDFSAGSDWLNSWKTAEVRGDPEVWLFRFQQAVEQATREKALFDEIGERFGQVVPGGAFKNKIEGHPYLQGYHFSEDIAKQIPRVVKDWTNPAKVTDPLMKHYDRLLSMWKSGVTIYRPAHHIRNLIGDAYLGWMDGVNGIKPYTLAARVQRTLKDMYPTLSDVDKLVELGVAGKSMATPRVGEVIFRNKTGVPFTAQQIAAVAHQKGLLEHARTIEDIIDLGEGSRFKPFGGKVQAVGRGASELVSHNTRLAHFIDKVMKSRGSNLEDIFEQASRRARKWHPTGLDLTDFEKKFMRRIIPFYSWIRKSTPLLLEGLLMNPGKVLVAPKAYGAIQEMQGIETGGIEDPFPVDQMFPEWLRAEGLGPLSSPDGWLGKFSNQQPPGYVMAGQGLNPLTQLMSQLSNPGKTILGSLTPAASIPLTLSSGQNLTTGEPISGPDARPGAMEEYLGSQVPIWSMVQGVTGVTPFGTTTKKGRGDQFNEAAINWLTGAGIKGTGPYVKQARYEKNKPKQVERSAAKQAFLEQLREMNQ
jgi:hypothetical protein